MNELQDADYYDLDDEERYGEPSTGIDDVGMEYTINPITGDHYYKDGE